MSPLQTFDYRAYGWLWRSDVELKLFEELSPLQRVPHIHVLLMADGLAPERKAIFTNHRSSVSHDGFRFRDRQEAVTDNIGPSRIEIYPGPDWKGIPTSFYGTTTGALMAWRGGIPIHASAVELDGKALLLCGPAGAGKSTVTAALLTRGARLISDDLTVLRPLGITGPPVVYSGRRCIRLFPQTASLVRQRLYTETIPSEGPKELVVVDRVPGDLSVPFGGFVFLGMPPDMFKAMDRSAIQGLMLFRPLLFEKIRGSKLRHMTLDALLARFPVAFCPELELSETFSLEHVADRVLESWQKALYPLQ